MTQPPRRPSRPPAAAARRGDGQTPHARRGVPPPARGAAATNAASAAASSSSAVYWQAQCEAALYAAPLGNVVGVAAAGTIIREHERFADPFGGVWLATHSTAATNDDDVNDDDEQLVWVCGVDGDAWASSSVVPPPPSSSSSPQWRRVSDAHVDDNDDADATTTTTPAADVCITCSSNDDDDSGESDLLCDAALLDYYWTSSATAALRARSRRQQQQQHNDDCKKSNNDSDEGCRNDICRSSVSWNARYQEAVEALMLPQQPQQHDDDNNDGDDDARVVALQACLDAFAAVAQAAVVTLLEDLPRATCERRMVQHATQPHAFYFRADSSSSSGDDDGDSATHGDLLLRLVVDTADGRYGGDAAAHAAAARQFRGYRLLAHVAPRWLLSLPLTALVTFGGHCVAVTALPPIVSRACVYDNSSNNNNNNNNNNVTCDALVSQLLTGVGHALNLRTHHVGTRTTTATMPRDVRVYAGRDRRLYVLRAGRVLPPLLPPPPSSRRVGDTPVVRAELLLRWPAPLNPDVDVRHDASCKCHEGSSSNLADDDENDDVSVARALARCVRDEVVTHVANILGMHAPVQLTGAAHEHALPLCTLCDVALADDELRFVVCTHADGCCAVCTHCYTRRVHDTAAGMTATAACSSSSSSSCTSASSPRVASLRRRDVATWCGRARFDDAVRCGTTPPRRGNALRLVPDLTALMHASGLCMRLLPFVLHRLPPAAAPFVRHYGEVEMLARAAARVLRRRLRRLPAVTPQHMQHTIEHVLRCLLVPRRRLRRTRNDNNNNDDDDDDDMVAARFWADELGPELQRHFVGVTRPFDTTTLSPLLLAERVQQLTGVTLDDASIASLRDTSYDDDSDNDNNDDSNKTVVVRVAQVQPLVKTYTTPQPHRHRQRVDDDDDDVDDAVRLRGVLERVLLFWIARAHDHGDDDDDVAPAQQPFYLRDSFVHADDDDVLSSAPVDSAHAYHGSIDDNTSNDNNDNEYANAMCRAALRGVSLSRSRNEAARVCDADAADVVLVRYKRYAPVWALYGHGNSYNSNSNSVAQLRVGRHVIVPGDRGWHCGVVVQHGVLRTTTTDRNTKRDDDEASDVGRAGRGVLLTPATTTRCVCGDTTTTTTMIASRHDTTQAAVPCASSSLHEAATCAAASTVARGVTFVTRVWRALTDAEEAALARDMLARERVALHIVVTVVQRLRLPMRVVDCEWQYDGRRITFFYYTIATPRAAIYAALTTRLCGNAAHRCFAIDFRALTRELFRTFGARIWLECLGVCNDDDDDSDDDEWACATRPAAATARARCRG